MQSVEDELTKGQTNRAIEQEGSPQSPHSMSRVQNVMTEVQTDSVIEHESSPQSPQHMFNGKRELT